MYTYPPIPDVSGLTTPIQNMVATAASTALPPCSSIARPILEQTVESDATAPDAPTYNRKIIIKIDHQMSMSYSRSI